MMGFEAMEETIIHHDGRYELTKKEFLELLLEAIEKTRITTNTPVGKRLMINNKCLANHIAFGTLKYNNYLERDTRKFAAVRGRVNRWLAKLGSEKSGKSWIITPEVISLLKKEVIPNSLQIKEPGRGNDNKTIKEQLSTLDIFVEEITGYRCQFCKKKIYYTKEEALQHLIYYHKLQEGSS